MNRAALRAPRPADLPSSPLTPAGRRREGLHALEHYWYSERPLVRLLIPLSWLYRLLVALRRLAYRVGVLRVSRLEVPVIVVGNITVGGTGKTPLVAWLAGFLQRHGYTPGLVSRGYGGAASQWPQQVRPDSDPVTVGDEAVLLAGRSGCPMAVGPRRVDAARALLRYRHCDILLSDDGLQHYALGRDVEIAVVDGVRRLGNGHLLPAGPLREPRRRLRRVDFIVANGGGGHGEYGMKLRPGLPRPVDGSGGPIAWDHFQGGAVHAVAGIGHPARFFETLRQQGLAIEEHAFPDHHRYGATDFDFAAPGDAILMTEKDAVKCRHLGRPNLWYVPVDAELDPRFGERLLALLERKKSRG